MGREPFYRPVTNLINPKEERRKLRWRDAANSDGGSGVFYFCACTSSSVFHSQCQISGTLLLLF